MFTSNEKINTLLDEMHIPSDTQLIVSKKITKDGKSSIKINYRSTTQMLLKTVMSNLVDIHSQFETHQLFKQSYHLQVLDDYCGKKLSILKEKFISPFPDTFTASNITSSFTHISSRFGYTSVN